MIHTGRRTCITCLEKSSRRAQITSRERRLKNIMPHLTIYQKPTCTTCRKVIKLVEEKGTPFTAINYYETPLTKAKLKSLLKKGRAKGPRRAAAKGRYLPDPRTSQSQKIRRRTDRPHDQAPGPSAASPGRKGRKGHPGPATGDGHAIALASIDATSP